MRKFIKELYFAAKKKQLTYTKKCFFEKATKINRNTKFEGNNRLAKGVELIDSYLGYASYLSENSCLRRCYIGKYTSVGADVYSIVGKHPTNFVSTHPAFFSLRKQSGFSYVQTQKYDEFEEDKYDGYATKIGNDVWIGSRTILREGINIGDGAIIGAGAVVVKDVPPFAIVGGVPAKLIRYRFERDEIDFLLKLRWWNKEKQWIAEHADLFEDIAKLKEKLEIQDNVR